MWPGFGEEYRLPGSHVFPSCMMYVVPLACARHPSYLSPLCRIGLNETRECVAGTPGLVKRAGAG